MKIVALLASPHGLRGSTARLLKSVLEGAKSAGAKTETIVLTWDKVHPCLGCDGCHKTGRCRQKDDFEAIKEKILRADGLILATPNYIDYVSAQLKVFMDRCCGIVHCLGFEGRYGAVVVTSGGGAERADCPSDGSLLDQDGDQTGRCRMGHHEYFRRSRLSGGNHRQGPAVGEKHRRGCKKSEKVQKGG